MSRHFARIFVIIGFALVSLPAARAESLPEVEPNDAKATATAVDVQCADQIVGTSTGNLLQPPGGLGSPDYFRVQTAVQPAGIYAHRLALASPQHTASLRIRGLDPASDLIGQSLISDPSGARFVQWFGFGRGESVYLRVNGTSSGAPQYTFEHACSTPAVLHAPPVRAGVVRIVLPSGWAGVVFGAQFELFSAASAQVIQLELSPGHYYLAASNGVQYIFSNNIRTDSPDVLISAGGGAASGTARFESGPSFALRNDVPLRTTSGGDAQWIAFVVGTETGAGACCSGGGCAVVASAADCAAQGGSFMGGETPCVEQFCPRACCLADGLCVERSASHCLSLGGESRGLGSVCANETCPALPGASCVNPLLINVPADLPFSGQGTTCGLRNSYACAGAAPGEDAVYKLVVSEPSCVRVASTSALLGIAPTCPPCSTGGPLRDPVLLAPGEYWLLVESPQCGAYSLMITECAPRACCFINGSCELLDPPACAAASGASQGSGSTCTPTICPPAVPCCLGTAACQNITREACFGGGGRVLSGETCEGNPCDEVRACCSPQGSCTELLVFDCLPAGLPRPAGVACPADCVAVCMRGDVNCDGSVDNFDIGAFLLAILNASNPNPPAGWSSSAGCWQIRNCTGDVAEDGSLNSFDIDPFVACILNLPQAGDPCP